ncbi:SsrA-binding protein [bacterium (Candidatus Torokbacteria) CG_4_10_14_0_2_um_filter_35_8]|nr:MAG: SsrA-binding protein [bacterium (Candidatus Torokbacteria) CG_4_10_14_0_2_um_filter_35_8]
MKALATNRRARYDYKILEEIEAGIVLSGQEVKSVKKGHISLKGSFVTLKGAEVFLTNAHISPYEFSGEVKEYNPERPRKLLLHKKEIARIIGKKKEQGLTLIPLKIYTKHRKIKVLIGIARGKKKFDKREEMRKKEAERKIQRAMRKKFEY